MSDAQNHDAPEWSGSPAPEHPDEWWIDDETGEYIRADDGARMDAETARSLIAKELGQ